MRRIILGVAALAAMAAGAVLTAGPAGATTGPDRFASCATNDGGACAGYVMSASGGFRFVKETAFLRNPDQYAAITNGVGWQDGLKSTGSTTKWDAIVGISDSSPANGAGFGPQSLVYQNGSIIAVAPNAVFCPAGGSCAPASQGGAFPVGATVTETVYYNQAEGAVDFDAFDTAGDVYHAFYPVGRGITFNQARIEAGFGTFTAPAAKTRLVNFTAAGVTTAGGIRTSLSSSLFTTSREIATSTGTRAAPAEAGPTALNSTGQSFAVNFQPAPCCVPLR